MAQTYFIQIRILAVGIKKLLENLTCLDALGCGPTPCVSTSWLSTWTTQIDCQEHHNQNMPDSFWLANFKFLSAFTIFPAPRLFANRSVCHKGRAFQRRCQRPRHN